MPEIENMKDAFDTFMGQASTFITKQKEYDNAGRS